MAFLLPKGLIKEIDRRLRTFLWNGTTASRYPKVAWEFMCRPLEESGQGIRDVLALNRALMSRHLWSVISHDRTFIWVDWITHYRLRDKSVWTVGYGGSFSLWHDQWHCLGPLILAFPRGPQLTQTAPHDFLNVVIDNGSWRWPLITNIACLEITRLLPPIHHGNDSITWTTHGRAFTTKTAYDLFRPSGPKVGWYSLLLGPFKIPRNSFILWLAILERLSTLDKPWLSHIDGACILCDSGSSETHNHLFFACSYARHCISTIRTHIRFAWPYMEWQRGVTWATARWRGNHIVNAAYRSLLASLVYHIWQERNRRRFQAINRPPSIVASIVIEEVKQRILSTSLRISVSTQGLYRLWHIPWPVEGNAN
ncbi:UNVERIFIED_CONTAM: hypothetical protein Sangu_3073900 [Sesamum angustifolium]|uniref:Reverse transcriptase zinc-binding domain-containing protein n=1 Tax=Sesamum angustifolium TaxID=2727405 RepID=A0AAW2KCR9_9LAMI